MQLTTINAPTVPVTDFSIQIGERIRIAREQNPISQDDFARKFGCNDRQTISAIETGLRQVSPAEIIRIAEILGKNLNFFTDPYLITDKQAFSYRAKLDSRDIAHFEEQTHKLISANRRFKRLLGEPESPFGNQIKNITKQFPVSSAPALGERAANFLELGEIPSLKLRNAVEQQLKVMILYVNAPESISGAACHLPDGDFILINRNEASFRRNFDLGHELFHILTWTTMPPNRLDLVQKEGKKSKIEKLADAFSAGLLMPFPSLQSRWAKKTQSEEIHQWILNTATEFGVSGVALYWRLVNTNLLSQQEPVDQIKLSRPDNDCSKGKPNIYNADFARRLHAVLSRGLVSVRKVADLLECDLHDLKEALDAYGYKPPFAL